MRASLFCLAALGVLLLCPLTLRGSVQDYDAAVTTDSAGGLVPAAKLTSATVFAGGNRLAFNFGIVSGDATFEFIVEGNPAAIPGTAYLAVGANTSSNLRYEQWQNTGQLGFTQLGVIDYLFTPGVPSPSSVTHIAYTWQASTFTMRMYVNGALVGTRAGVSAAFAMPAGQGWLGGNPVGGELFTGTIHRVTTYDDLIAPEVILRHADAFNGIIRPPVVAGFAANPDIIFSPASSTLSWQVLNADSVFLNGSPVGPTANLVVSPTVTTPYGLVATNQGGSVTSFVTVVVNPAPIITSFISNPGYAVAGENVTLNWSARYGEEFTITPGVGDVTVQTINGVGSINVTVNQATTFTLTVANAFGNSPATTSVSMVQPASHLVISEFMASNESTLADEDGTFSDWIEIYNPTASPINASGYYLTDDKAEPTLWAFPSTNIAPRGHLLLFASGKDRRVAGAPLHTNFQLDRAGEYLALIGPGLTLLHAFDPFPAQQSGTAYGILGGDPSLRRYFGIPTPGASNNDAPAPPAPIEFSRASGTFVDPFALTLTSPTPGATIRYTLNGSLPSATNGTVYAGPITVDASRRVRAIATADGLASRVAGESFIKIGPDLRSYTSSLPILVIENFGAGIIPQKGWSGNGSGLRQVPRQTAVWATFERTGAGTSLTNAAQMVSTIGIRGRGAFSSEWRQKPYSVEAIDEAGEEREVGPLDLPEHSDWVLYFPDPDTNKDPPLLFNTFAYALSANTGHYAVRFRWVEAFVNEDGGDLRLADRRGVYAIIEKVSRGPNRLDFQRLAEDGTTGSWLLNLNRMDPEPETGWPAANGATVPWFFHTAGPNRIVQTPANAQVVGDDEPQQSNGYLNFDNPTGHTVNTNQRAAIEAWFKTFEDVLWNNALWRDPTNGYRRHLDEVDFADYFILNTLTRNGDGLLISMFPWKGDDGKLRMGPAWDFNWSPYFVSGGPTGTLLHRPDRIWYRRLFADPDFAQLYIDRWWDHRRHGMSNADMDAIIDRQAADISPAKALLNGIPSETDWNSRLTQLKTWLKDRANWIDGNYLRPPIFNQDGGPVGDGFQLTIIGTNGTIYFTLDGSDPRAAGGPVAASAQAFQLPFTVTDQMTVSARIRNGTNWSGLTRSVFYPPQNLAGLAITEIMFNPPPFGAFTANDLEFLELKNTGATPINLGTLTFSSGINFSFPNGTRLMPGSFFVLARNPAAFGGRYPGVTVNGSFTGQLDNAGETLRLSTVSGATILAVTYNDRSPWPLAPDGHGHSLVPRTGRPANSDLGIHWRASGLAGGSPGADDPESIVPAIYINELVSRSAPPGLDWVELYNPNPSAVDVSGWLLSDDGGLPAKYRIPAETSIPALGYLVLSETAFNAPPGSALAFSFDSAGDSVYLSSADAATNLTGFSHGFQFGAGALGASFGRHVISTGEEQFPILTSPTPNTANTPPRVGPVVIGEVHYHPNGSEPEFVELRNISNGPVPLFDSEVATNTWRLNGLGFTFPSGITLPVDGVLILAGTDPLTFRARYELDPAVPVLGPFLGTLQDSGERLELQRPEDAGTNGWLFVTIDDVRYNDRAPWPPAADGGGASLQRRVLTAFGNDPANWAGAPPTPGLPYVPGAGPPVIVTPPANSTAVATREATFNVVANGPGPLFYQWLFGNDLLSGGTNATLVLSNIQPAQAGQYSVIVFNQAGSVQSASAQLSVRAPAVILTQPKDVQIRIRPDPLSAPTTNVTFAVVASSSSPIRYQWRFNGTNLPGATNASVTVTNVQLANEGVYTAAITDDAGTIFTAPATLQPWISPLILQAPLSQIVPVSSPVTLSVEISGSPAPFAFEWRRGSGPMVTNSSAQRIDFFTFTATNVPQTNQYRVVVKNAANTSPGVPSVFANIITVADADADGLPDEWESAFGLNPQSAADRLLDADGDGVSNAAEYTAGTNPNDPSSYLRIEPLTGSLPAVITFGAVSNKTYAVEYTDQLGLAWSRLAAVPARTNNHVRQIADPGFTTNRFYRVATPGR